MRPAVPALLLLTGALVLGGCGVSAEVPRPPEASAGAVSAGPVEDAPEAVRGPAGTSAPVSAVPAVVHPPMPAVAPATGTTVTSGSVTLEVPATMTPVEVPGVPGVQFFDGPPVPGSERPDGTAPVVTGVQVHAPAPAAGWDGTIDAWGLPGTVDTFFAVPVPGATAAVLRFTDRPVSGEVDDGTGRMVWQGASGTGEVVVQVGDELVRVTLVTGPGQAGLDQVLAVAASLRVTS